jgi:hypothetical protein
MDMAQSLMAVITGGISWGEETTQSRSTGIGGLFTGGSQGAWLSTGSSSSESNSVSMSALVKQLGKTITNEAGVDRYVRSHMTPEPKYLSEAYSYWDAERKFRITQITSRWRHSTFYCGRCAGVFVLGEPIFAYLNAPEPVMFSYPVITNHDLSGIEWSYRRGKGIISFAIMCLFAFGIGRQGVYFIAMEEFPSHGHSLQGFNEAGTLEKDSHGTVLRTPYSGCGTCTGVHAQLVSRMYSAGWVRDQRVGGYSWWQWQFTHPN